MSITLAFLAVVAAIAGWWLSQHRLAAKPWLEEGPLSDLPGAGRPSLPVAKIGLGVFLAVVGALFALFASAYSMRMHMGDWAPLPEPKLLWLNTGILVLSSVALHWAQVSARRADIDGVRSGLLAGGACALGFLVGQLFAWRELNEAGYYLASNPANAFFYLITALHGLHLLGGLVALGRTTARAWSAVESEPLQLSIELCAMYWHFLLLIWLLLFGLMSVT